MVRNYIAIALRGFRRHAGFSAINVVGLAVGIACCILIASFVASERSFDRFHEKADRIYRVNSEFVQRGISSFTDGAVGPALVEAFPEVERAVRMFRSEHLVARSGRGSFGWQVAFADSSFFDVFDFQLLRGDAGRALTAPWSVVLTQTLAESLFGAEDPLGRSVTLDGRREYTVTGVVEDVPVTSHYRFDALASHASIVRERPGMESWGSISQQTYVLLRPGVSRSALQNKLVAFANDRYDGGNGQAWLIPTLYPLTDIHLHSPTYELEPQGDIRSVRVILTVGLFILLLACVNYINLSTARSVRRAREVGVRKVAGARNYQLIGQFLTESMTTVVIAVLLGTGLAYALHPLLLNVSGLDPFPLVAMATPGGLAVMAGATVLIGVAAGLYPAFVLSRFAPARVLKGSWSAVGRDGALLRKSLVVAQFTISIALLAGTILAGRQIAFMRSYDLGFDRENVVNIPVREAGLIDRAKVVLDEIVGRPGVAAATISSSDVSEFMRSAPVSREEDAPIDRSPTTGFVFTDAAYLETFGIDLIAGENFAAAGAPNPSEVLLTEEAVRRLEYESAAAAVGTDIHSGFFREPLTIRGVVADVHFRPLRSGLVPAILINDRLADDAVLSVRLAAGDQRKALQAIRETWTEVIPEWPFEYVYLDEIVEQRSRSSRRMASLFGMFSGLAILIGCLGLFGLAAHMAATRTKEIGVRKVLGASVRQILVLLSREFSLLVLLSGLAAAPLIRFLGERWLEGFAFRIEWTWSVLVLAAGAALLLALVTVSTQALRAALVDPVEALRDE